MIKMMLSIPLNVGVYRFKHRQKKGEKTHCIKGLCFAQIRLINLSGEGSDTEVCTNKVSRTNGEKRKVQMQKFNFVSMKN